MFHHFDDLVIVVTGIAAFLVSVGVIWRYIVNPIRELGSRLQDHWDYLNDQLANGKHKGTLREQVNRIDEGQVVVREKQEQQAAAIASLQAQVRQVAATTNRTEVTTTETAAALDVVHEAVVNPTGEHPIIP